MSQRELKAANTFLHARAGEALRPVRQRGARGEQDNPPRRRPCGLCQAKPPEESHIVDPVCRMHLDREHAAGSLHYEGHEYWCPSTSALAGGRECPPTRG